MGPEYQVHPLQHPFAPHADRCSQRTIPDKVHKDVERTKDECDDCHGVLIPTGETEEVIIENVIPAHNNGGKLAARALVVMRKVIGGTRSERGTEVHAHFISTSQTAHKQGIDHSDFIIEVLAAQHAGKPPPTIFSS
jgi:hypothetical protein